MTTQVELFIPQSCLDVNEVMTVMIQRAKHNQLNPADNQAFIHGMTWKEVARTFGHCKNYTLKRYDNRQRDLYHPYGLAGKHYVHGEIHYFPLKLDVEGFIDHSRCRDCTSEKTEETQP